MIGLLPAAGNASRIHGLPKYLLPIPGGYLLKHHLDAMRGAGIGQVMIGANPDNMGLIYDYADPDGVVYLASQRETMTQTVLSSAYQHESVLFGMPDTYLPGPYVYLALRAAIEAYAHVAVALFKARPGQHKQGGMCRVEGGRVVEVVDKPTHNDFEYIWGALAWQPECWDCLESEDPHVGYGLPRAIAAGMNVQAVMCEGDFWDCGTETSYFECIRAIAHA
jgi:dTDP-glucose pyrophosphorylase